jgi:serine/threonine-protein kinase
MEVAENKRIGRYVLEQYLGGGMAKVYRARDLVMNRTVALKVLTPENANNPEAKARFLREAQLAASVEHDHILRVYDFGEVEGETYLVTEFLHGRDLANAMQSGQIGGLSNRLEMLRQLTLALEAVHGLGITHRDVKPANVHLDTSGRIRLMDFGIARSPQLQLTRTGETVGTPSYMAPEQVTAGNINHLADIYSFGVLAFELLSGEKPYNAETLEGLFFKILNQPADFDLLRAAQCPESVINLVMRCLAKAPEGRPQSTSEIELELKNLLAAVGQTNRPEFHTTLPLPLSPPFRKPRWTWIAITAAFLLMSVAIWMAPHSQSTEGVNGFPPLALSKQAGPSGIVANARKRASSTGHDRRSDEPKFKLPKGEHSQSDPYHDEPHANPPFDK